MQTLGPILSFMWLLNQISFLIQQPPHRKTFATGVAPLVMVSVVDPSVVALDVVLRRLHDQCLQHQTLWFHCEHVHGEKPCRSDHTMAELTFDVKNLH